jgi:hypothetical protein
MSMFFLLVTTAVVGAAPQPAPDAAKLFDEGRAALKANDLPRACEAFMQSHQLQPGLGVLLNLATCLERQGKVASAWVRFNEAVTWAVRTHEGEREQLARASAAKLKARLSWLAVSAAGECEVSVDGAPAVAVSPSAPTSLPVDPGEHRLVASATGFEPWTTTLKSADGAQASVSVPALKSTVPPVPAAAAQAPVTPGPAASSAGAPPPPPPPPLVVVEASPSGPPAAGLVLLVAGGVVAIAGGVGLGWSATTYASLQGQRASLPTPDVQVSRATFDQLTWVYPASWVVLGVGAAAAVTGVVLTVRGARVSPMLAPGTAGVSVSGTF